MREDSVQVTNNDTTTIQIVISDNNNSSNVKFVQSINSALSVHNSDKFAHDNIIPTKVSDLKNDSGFLTNESDPIFNASAAKNISSTDVTNWDIAYANNHIHGNKSLLDNLTSAGNGKSYLSNDGSYKTIDSGKMLLNPLGTISANFILVENEVTTGYVSGNFTLTLPTISDNTKETKCIFDFTTINSSYPVINTSGITLNKKDGKAFIYSTLSSVHNKLEFITEDGGLTWEVELKQYGGAETAFIQPILTANGTLGGNNFAVYNNQERSGWPTWQAFDNNYSTTSDTNSTPNYLLIYNPQALKVSNFAYTNSSDARSAIGWTVYGSNDNNNYITLASGTNSQTGGSVTWNISIPVANQAFYNYYKLYFSSSNGGNNCIITNLAITATYIAT